MTHVDLHVMIANGITLTAPAEPGLTWTAQVSMFENTYLAEHTNPYRAVAEVVRELKDNDLYKEPGEDVFDIYSEHVATEEFLDDEKEQAEQAAKEARKEELQELTGFYSDQYSPGEAGYCDPRKARWEEVEHYPIEQLLCEELPSREEWEEWFRSEINLFVEDGMDEIADMYRDMITQDIEEAIIVLERDGKAYIWDGNHRVGAAFSSGKTTIRAIVGRPGTTVFGVVLDENV